MTIIPYDQPGTLRKYLTEQRWGTQVINNQAMAVFCPLCYAMVPTSSDPNFDPRQHHIEYHVNQSRHMMQHIEKITELERVRDNAS